MPSSVMPSGVRISVSANSSSTSPPTSSQTVGRDTMSSRSRISENPTSPTVMLGACGMGNEALPSRGREEIVAKQLAHNRLSGFDDDATLKQLFASLNDPSLILESGLADDLMVLPHVDLAVGITPMLDMDWKVITLTFLPHQLENFNTLIDMMPSSDMVGLAPLSDYQLFIDALIKWGRYKDVRNVGTALALLADIALVELAEAAEAEENDAKSVG